MPSGSLVRDAARGMTGRALDVLSDALRVIRLKGALFLNAEFREPWCVAAPSGAELAKAHWRSRDELAICHLIVEGRCWIRAAGAEPLALEAGDVVMLPRGDAHQIGSGLNHAPVHERHAIELELPRLRRASYGGDGAATLVVCGWFAYDRNILSPAMAALPRVFRTAIRCSPSGAWLEGAIRQAVQEAALGRPGSDAVTERLAELLFLEALRGHLATLPARQTGWLAGLRDPVVGRCIALMHERPAHAWTVASLARAVNASRTVLAERFASLAGMPPMQYLTQWRLALAAQLLRDRALSLARIAEQIGYESEAAFSRAFKRRYGTPPGSWRRRGAP